MYVFFGIIGLIFIVIIFSLANDKGIQPSNNKSKSYKLKESNNLTYIGYKEYAHNIISNNEEQIKNTINLNMTIMINKYIELVYIDETGKTRYNKFRGESYNMISTQLNSILKLEFQNLINELNLKHPHLNYKSINNNMKAQIDMFFKDRIVEYTNDHINNNPIHNFKIKQTQQVKPTIEQNTDLIKCNNCGSTQISANKKGFGIGKAAAGVILTGGIGALGGFIGSNKIVITCLKCGHKWKP